MPINKNPNQVDQSYDTLLLIGQFGNLIGFIAIFKGFHAFG
jgi:hypothetical protein